MAIRGSCFGVGYIFIFKYGEELDRYATDVTKNDNHTSRFTGNNFQVFFITTFTVELLKFINLTEVLHKMSQNYIFKNYC